MLVRGAQPKEMESKYFMTVQTKVSWKGKDSTTTTSKSKFDVKKLSSEEV